MCVERETSTKLKLVTRVPAFDMLENAEYVMCNNAACIIWILCEFTSDTDAKAYEVDRRLSIILKF